MDFHNWQPRWNRNACRYSDFDPVAAERSWNESSYGAGQLMAVIEGNWLADVRPYYKVWPSIYSAMERIPLDLTLNKMCINPGLFVSIRFGVGCEPRKNGPIVLHSMIVGSTPYNVAIGKHYFNNNFQVPHYIEHATWLSMTDDRTVDEIVSEVTGVESYDMEITNDVPLEAYSELDVLSAKIAIGLLLLDKDPSIFERDVLAKDRTKYAESGEERYIEKARKRGVNGWSVGRKFESMPHWRRPHLGLRWTGIGKSIPKIVPIKGSVVHRSSITNVPTGYTLPSGQDVEPKNDFKSAR